MYTTTRLHSQGTATMVVVASRRGLSMLLRPAMSRDTMIWIPACYTTVEVQIITNAIMHMCGW